MSLQVGSARAAPRADTRARRWVQQSETDRRQAALERDYPTITSFAAQLTLENIATSGSLP
jgi:hypothetical protein